MELGASLPIGDIGPSPVVVRDYAQAAEGLGFSYLALLWQILRGTGIPKSVFL